MFIVVAGGPAFRLVEMLSGACIGFWRGALRELWPWQTSRLQRAIRRQNGPFLSGGTELGVR